MAHARVRKDSLARPLGVGLAPLREHRVTSTGEIWRLQRLAAAAGGAGCKCPDREIRCIEFRVNRHANTMLR